MQEVNVKVAVRVRPLLRKEKVDGEKMCVKFNSKNNQLVIGVDRAFTFDYILPTKCTQDEVYEKCVNDLVDGCFEGYNATVFAYGQTGSGKTYTIGGGNIATQTEAEFGIIPRAVRRFFERIEGIPNRSIMVKVSHVEIYMEELRDLLDVDSKDLQIRDDHEGQTLIIGAEEVRCESVDEVMALLEQGSSYRHTASTNMNDVSSRSHSVFTMYVEQRWRDGPNGDELVEERNHDNDDDMDDSTSSRLDPMEHLLCAKFHFVDLAGSERAHRTGNVGDRFKESVHINSGLLALGNVISALADCKKKATHIPYRESKITRLLKDSLGGNARTLMICCISPATSNFDETLNALKYANRAKNIRNKPIINRDPESLQIEAMQTELNQLRAELRERTNMMGNGDAGAGDMRRAVEEAAVIKQLEDKVVKIQTECSHYRMVAEEAFKQLQEIGSRDILSTSMDVRLKDWMSLMEEIKNKVPATLSHNGAWQNETIHKLEHELQQCRNDLKNDEEIFADKARESDNLKEKLEQMEAENRQLSAQLHQAEDRLKQQEETMVSKEMTIEALQARLQELESEHMPLGESTDDLPVTPGTNRPPAGVISDRRAKSVPVHMLGDRGGNKKGQGELAKRNIHTSPALISIERVMQGFRARSQLLVSRLEDSDDVMQPHFSEDEVSDNEEEEEEEVFTSKTKGKKGMKSSFQRNGGQRRTYKVNRPKVRQTSDDDVPHAPMGEKLTGGSRTYTKDGSQRLELNSLHCSTELKKRQLKKSEMDVRQSTQQVKELGINIKLKEELIRELVKSTKEANVVNKQYQEKIAELEKEKQYATNEIANLQKAAQELEAREQNDKVEKDKLQTDVRKKMDTHKARIQALQKKQKETEKLASLNVKEDKKIADLEIAVGKLKQLQETTQRKLKEEMDRKAKIERDFRLEQQKIKELEIRNEQQTKVLKIKTEEVTGLQRKLRNGSSCSSGRLLQATLPRLSMEAGDDVNVQLEEQKRYMEQEIEKVLEQRAKMQQLEKELGKREDDLVKREAFLEERNELHVKKLRSSQRLSKDVVSLSSKLASVHQKIDEKSKELSSMSKDPSRMAEEMRSLQETCEKLNHQKATLEHKLQEGAVLSDQEERRLIEIEEGIEALDEALRYKNDDIQNQERELKHAVDKSTDQVMSRLSTLSTPELRILLAKYFERVIDLRDESRQKSHEQSQMEVQMESLDHEISELRAALSKAGLELDRKLTEQQKQHETKIQKLLQQLASAGRGGGGGGGEEVKEKMQKLEKELFFFKSKNREMKRQLKDMASGLTSPGANGMENGGDPLSPRGSEMSSSGSSMKQQYPRSAPPSSSRHSGSSTSGVHSGTPRTGPSGPMHPAWDHLPELRDGVGGAGAGRMGSRGESRGEGSRAGEPVRISRKDLRRMSNDEVQMRKSTASENMGLLTDSLEVSKNNQWN